MHGFRLWPTPPRMRLGPLRNSYPPSPGGEGFAASRLTVTFQRIPVAGPVGAATRCCPALAAKGLRRAASRRLALVLHRSMAFSLRPPRLASWALHTTAATRSPCGLYCSTRAGLDTGSLTQVGVRIPSGTEILARASRAFRPVHPGRRVEPVSRGTCCIRCPPFAGVEDSTTARTVSVWAGLDTGYPSANGRIPALCPFGSFLARPSVLPHRTLCRMSGETG